MQIYKNVIYYFRFNIILRAYLKFGYIPINESEVFGAVNEIFSINYAFYCFSVMLLYINIFLFYIIIDFIIKI
ncbi:MAG: hypothetical protein EAZ53_15790 [Bacteroidetes bacterium]|nr:MAG: hypothetical protein EAZ53_15790 [Bacteroidota bacterium]